jgi:hypothetical protein
MKSQHLGKTPAGDHDGAAGVAVRADSAAQLIATCPIAEQVRSFQGGSEPVRRRRAAADRGS